MMNMRKNPKTKVNYDSEGNNSVAWFDTFTHRGIGGEINAYLRERAREVERTREKVLSNKTETYKIRFQIVSKKYVFLDEFWYSHITPKALVSFIVTLLVSRSWIVTP